MSRSQYKEIYVIKKLLLKQKKVIKLWSRDSVILPKFVGKTFKIHQGKRFISVKISTEMIGHKFGEFAPTRQKRKAKTNQNK
jgi:small subunit ribosomal protein S19|tara:strand:+ start:906 stop:1151 length:246 start_codon:yes stop_codon:yes gene_type:complete